MIWLPTSRRCRTTTRCKNFRACTLPSYVWNFCSLWPPWSHTRPKAVAEGTGVVPGHGGPLHLHFGLHGDKVHVGGGTSSGLNIAPITIVQKPVACPWWGAPCPRVWIWARKGAIHSITQFLSDHANIFRSFWPCVEAIVATESRNFEHRKVWYPSTCSCLTFYLSVRSTIVELVKFTIFQIREAIWPLLIYLLISSLKLKLQLAAIPHSNHKIWKFNISEHKPFLPYVFTPLESFKVGTTI